MSPHPPKRFIVSRSSGKCKWFRCASHNMHFPAARKGFRLVGGVGAVGRQSPAVGGLPSSAVGPPLAGATVGGPDRGGVGQPPSALHQGRPSGAVGHRWGSVSLWLGADRGSLVGGAAA